MYKGWSSHFIPHIPLPIPYLVFSVNLPKLETITTPPLFLTLMTPYPSLPPIHCMNFGIYKTFTFHVNMPKDPLSSPLLGIYFTFAFKSKRLKGDLFVIFTWCFKDSNVPLCGVFMVNLNMTFILCKSV